MPDIEKVTFENAADRLKDAIRAAFVELLPPEQWKAMVETELRRFTQKPSDRDQWGNYQHRPSPFGALCESVFSDFVKAELKAMLASPEWSHTWDATGKQTLSDAVKTWLTLHQEQLVQSTVMALAGQAAQNVLANIR